MTDGPLPAKMSLSSDLRRSDAEIAEKFSKLVTAGDVADLLEIKENQLTYILWRKPEDKRYQSWKVRKRNGGFRDIDAPTKAHKILQRKLARVLMLVGRVRDSAHGFVLDRSILTNARRHTRQRWVLNVDLQDFFPSINFGRVRGMLKSKPYGIGERAATALGQLCCHQKRLPQGAPTSPVISNMICARLDSELTRVAREYGCTYSRYVDDLTFSTSAVEFPEELAALKDEGILTVVGRTLREVIENNGFQINPEKVRLQMRTRRQEVTGLVVNRRPNVKRSFVAQIRAMLHAWEKFGYAAAEGEFLAKYDSKHRPQGYGNQFFEHVVRGKLAFLKQVRGDNDARYVRLRLWLAQLAHELVVVSPGTGGLFMYDVFICHASEDKEAVVRPLAKVLRDANVNVWLDEGEITWGESITQKINDGLSKSRFVILVLSDAFMSKKWPVKEMNAVLSQEIRTGVTRALPLMVGPTTTQTIILSAYPLLDDKRYLEWSPSDIGHIVATLKAKLQK